jgi:xanthine dehydrogenase accessory factor
MDKTDVFDEIVRIKSEGDVAALATVISAKGSTPRAEGSKMLIKSDKSIAGSIGGGCLEADVWKAGMKVIEERKSQLLSFDLTGREETPEGLICGGTMQVYVEPIIPVPVVYLFGAGHIGYAVSKIAKMTGFKVVVIDDRPAYANEEKFPDADKFYVEDLADVVGSLPINKVSYLVIACRGHLEDQRVLAAVINTPAAYIGMIGSKKKTKTIFENLKAEGIDEKLLQKVHAPIGLPIAAETPEDIAVSIMAEIVDIRRRNNGKHSAVSGSPVPA